jgi:multiple sugar transport system substrate-binding protein
MTEGIGAEHGQVHAPSQQREHRQRTRRRLAGSAGGLIGAAAAACGASGGADDQRQQGQPTLVQGPTRITWTFWATQDNLHFFEKTARAFEQQFPQVKVETSWVTGAYAEKIIAMVTGGTPPDAMATTRPIAPGWAIQGITLALDPYLQRGGFREADYFPNAVSPWRYGGKLYALPREVDSWTLWYNRRAFDEAGIKPPDETWTWETFVDRAQRLTKREGGTPQYGFFPAAFTHKLWVAVGAQNGAKLYDREALPTRLLVNQPAVTDALQWVADLRHKWRVLPTDEEVAQVPNASATTLFQGGRIATMLGESTNAIRFADTIKDFAYDVAVPPKGRQHGTWLGGACYTVPKSTSKREAGVQFVMFTSGPDGQRIIAEERFGTPAIKRVAESDVFLKTPPPANKRALRQAFDWGAGPPMTPVFADVEAALAAELTQTWAGRRLAKDSVAAAWPKVEDLMRQAQEMARQLAQ